MRCLAAISLVLALSQPALSAQTVDYLRDVKPIFARHCYKCHGAREQKSDLRLDTAAFALKGGQRGPAIVAGSSSQSRIIQAVKGEVPEMGRMPFKMTPLEPTEVAKLARWIDAGAKAPPDEQPEDPLAAGRSHWAFQPPKLPAVPEIRGQRPAVRNPIDSFILARLAKDKIKPSPEADRVTLIRRLSLDLTGLPPSIAEVDAFLADPRPDAYERLVERLLASPHYGERWGRWWLDVARYADSNGYSIDAPRQIWKYRDWVIAAFNRDLPFDQFAIEQLAGDLLPGATLDQRIATGFHRNTQINQEGGIDKEQFRIESVVDRVGTTGTAFLGLTIACAQCHDHKFDPISQREYFQMFAFFNNQDEPELPIATPEDLARGRETDAKVAAYIASLPEKDATVWERMLAWERGLTAEQRQAQTEAVRGAFDHQFEKRSEEQKRLTLTAFVEQAAENKKHQQAIAKLRASRPKITSTLVLAERKQPRETYIHIKGDFTRKGDTVGPATPAVLHPLKLETQNSKPETADRLDFARWLVSRDNPLMARVTVNRVWQQYFGKGLVETENDFGTQGLPPTHPELLDWLAIRFMDDGWSLKQLHKLIVTSATYRQSSKARPDLAIKDPNNKLLARQNRLRLDAEIVRDVALSASGLLHPQIGGPSVFPPQPDGVMSLGQVKREWKPSEGPDRYRRGMYTFLFRATPHPALNVFDAPDAFSACTRRPRSNTPLQALTLLNDQAFHEFAQNLAQRVLRESPATDKARLEHAFRLCVARKPSADETAALSKLLAAERALQSDANSTEPWLAVARVVLNLDETITRE